MGKTGGKCPRQCLTSLLTCSLTNYRKPRRGIGMSWKNKESSTSAREGADPLSSGQEQQFCMPCAISRKEHLSPASPPSPPWWSLFPQQPTVPCGKAWVAFSMPKETWIKSIKKWLWAGCGAGSKRQRVGCWSARQSAALPMLVLKSLVALSLYPTAWKLKNTTAVLYPLWH